MTRITRAALLRRALPASLGAGLLPAPAVRAQAPIEITYYHWQTGVAGRSLRGLLDAFQAENPGILVRDIFKQSDQITAEIQSVVAARRPLDVAQVLGRNVLFIKANLPVVPLDEDRAAGEWLGRFAPNFLGLGDRGGRPYAMPHSFGTPVAYLNLDLLAQAGISTPPATWADATAAALAVRERTGRAGIAHIQTAANPGRHEPGTGELNDGFVFAHLDTLGYSGWIGCEYKPATTTEAGLGWLQTVGKPTAA